MGTIHLLPPAVALVLAGTWIGVQRRSLTAMERDNVTLQTHLSAARLTSPGADPSVFKAVKNTGPIDWKKIAREQQSSLGDPRVMMRFKNGRRRIHKRPLSGSTNRSPRGNSTTSRSTAEIHFDSCLKER